MTSLTGDTTIPPLMINTPLIEEGLVKDEHTNEVYLTLTSTVVRKRKKETLHVPLDFENNLAVDALMDSGAYVSAIAQKNLDTIKQKAPNKILKNDVHLIYQIQVANGQLEKPSATATLKFENGDNIFDEYFVVMNKKTRPIFGLQFIRTNSEVIDTTHSLIQFPNLTMQGKTASSQTTAKPKPLITADALTIPPRTTKTITALLNHPSKWNTTGPVTSLEKFAETASLLISHSMSATSDKRIAVRVTNATESPFLIKKYTDCTALRSLSHFGRSQAQ